MSGLEHRELFAGAFAPEWAAAKSYLAKELSGKLTFFVLNFAGFGRVEVGVEIGVSVLAEIDGLSEPDEDAFCGDLIGRLIR